MPKPVLALSILQATTSPPFRSKIRRPPDHLVESNLVVLFIKTNFTAGAETENAMSESEHQVSSVQARTVLIRFLTKLLQPDSRQSICLWYQQPRNTVSSHL